MSRLNISVAMCTFNGAPFLSAQLESIAAQDRPPDELILCDDDSTDESRDLIAQFARRSAFPTRVIVNKINLGSTKNFEQAISLCQGQIVALADQDDVWYQNKLDLMEKAFLRSNEIVAVFSDADLIGKASQPLGLRLWPTFGFDAAKQKQFADGLGIKVLIRHPVVTGATMAFRRDLFASLVPIPQNEIHDRWLSFLLAAQGAFAVIHEPLMQYRSHEKQQIGHGPTSYRGQVLQAKSRGAGHYFDEIVRFGQLKSLLQNRMTKFPFAEEAVVEIDNKIMHLEHRASLPHKKFARIPGIVREVVNGNYWRYSGGWRSLGKDLIVR
jgi:glycosyltransferase involved in cell wall biosynthesis